MAKVARRDLQKEAGWRRRLRRQAESGRSVRAWCRQHRVTETAFYWWRKELARRDREQKSAARPATEGQAVAFVPVHVTGEPGRDGDKERAGQRDGRGGTDNSANRLKQTDPRRCARRAWCH